MSAIITENFRKNNAQSFLNDIDDVATAYYIGLGRSQAWPDTAAGLTETALDYNVTQPLGTYGDNQDLLNNLTTLVGLIPPSGLYSRVMPNIAARVSHRHKAYNPFDQNCFYQTTEDGIEMYPCYVVVSNNVYLCLREATAILETYNLPDGSSLDRSPATAYADGSIWTYVYTIGSNTAIFPISSPQFVSVPLEATLDSTNVLDTLESITTATGDMVFSFTVLDGGSGYVSPPTVAFVGDSGTEIALEATVVDGAVTSIAYPIASHPNTWARENGYVRIDSGNARAVPNKAPALGFGYTPVNDLPTWYAGISVDASEEIYGDGAYIPYRQVSIVKDPEYEVGTTDADASLRCLQYLVIGGVSFPSGNNTGSLITQTVTGGTAIGIIDHYDSINKYLYYHQTVETGYIPFEAGTVDADPDVYTVASVQPAEYVKGSGGVIFAENRKAISRTTGQTEEITIILQF